MAIFKTKSLFKQVTRKTVTKKLSQIIASSFQHPQSKIQLQLRDLKNSKLNSLNRAELNL